MDRKAILVLLACFVLLFLSGPLIQKIYPPIPAPTNQWTTATAPAPGEATDGGETVRRPAPSISAPHSPVLAWDRPGTPEERVVIEHLEARYVFTSHGGGIQDIELQDYPASIHCGRRRAAEPAGYAALNLHATVPALSLFGGPALEDAVPFRLRQDGVRVTADKDLSNGLRVVKDFVASTNHQLLVTMRIENATNAPVALPELELVVGTATPLERDEQERFLGVQHFDGRKPKFIGEGWFANRFLGCFPGTPRLEYRSPGLSNVVWAAVHNRFFTMIAAPENPAWQMRARKMDLDWPEQELRGGKRRSGYQATLVHPPGVIAPGQALEWRLVLYAGPKEYNRLASLGLEQDQAMNFTAFFGWFARALLLSMNGLHGLGLTYGLAIVVITVIIKLLFWPLTQASTRSMKRMQALQPQMKAIQEKYKEDPRKMNQKLMEFMKENRVSPLGGCLPILLQIPVFIGFYQMLQSAVELRGARFLWACDLSQPDTILLIFGFPLNPLPLIMGATQFWQMRLTPMSPGMDPVQQKIMQYMPLIFIFILYSFPAGLALYWTVQNLLTILQMKLTKTAPGAATPGAPGPVALPAAPVAAVKVSRKPGRKRNR